MPEQNITLIAEQEAGRLCPNDERARKEYQRSILASLREWERRRAEDPKATDWQLLGSVIARIEAEHHPASEYFQERMTWARGVASRLLERDGIAYVMADTGRRRICYTFAFYGFTDGGQRRARPNSSADLFAS